MERAFADEQPAAKELEPAAEAAPLDQRSAGEWTAQFRQWQRVMEGDDAEAQADVKEQIAAVRDPQAVKAIEKCLDGKPKNRDFVLLLIGKLGAIGDADAARVLTHLAVIEREQHAADFLAAVKDRDAAISEILKYMRTDKYAPRASVALEQGKFVQPLSVYEAPNQKLTYALIEALRLKRSAVVPVDYWYFHERPRRGGRHWSAGARRALVKTEFLIPNPVALTLLSEYSGMDYGYDEDAWKKWYTSKKRVAEQQLES